MISTRGPQEIMVLERSAVPIHEIIGALCQYKTIEEITTRYPVDETEIWVCAEIFSEQLGPNSQDFVAMYVYEDSDGERHVETVNVSDWVFVSCVLLGTDIIEGSNSLPDPMPNIHELYSIGVEEAVSQCIDDLINDNENFREVELFNMIWDSFEAAWEELKPGAVDELLSNLRQEKEHLNDQLLGTIQKLGEQDE